MKSLGLGSNYFQFGIFSRIMTEVKRKGLWGKLKQKIDRSEVTIELNGTNSTHEVCDRKTGETVKYIKYNSSEPVIGTLIVHPKSSEYKHQGIIIELIGAVTPQDNAIHANSTFLISRQVHEAAVYTQTSSIPFKFTEDKKYESYTGLNYNILYLIRITLKHSVKNYQESRKIWVEVVDRDLIQMYPDTNTLPSYIRDVPEEYLVKESNVIYLDVGIKNEIHILFQSPSRVYHLNERLYGFLYFKMMDLDIHYGEITILRTETPLSEDSINAVDKSLDKYNHANSETLYKYEIIDGTPIAGEHVPIRLDLSGVKHLTPSYPNVYNCLSVRYYFNLVLLTIEGRRYFKKQEITLYRRN